MDGKRGALVVAELLAPQDCQCAEKDSRAVPDEREFLGGVFRHTEESSAMFVETLPEATRQSVALLGAKNIVKLTPSVKALTYFEDAESEPMPRMLERVSWNAVKQFFENKAPLLFKTL